MKLNLYAVLDKKAKIYFFQNLQANDALAVREFDQQVNQSGSKFNLYPEDFELYNIGSYDLIEGRLTANDYPQPIITALSLKR